MDKDAQKDWGELERQGALLHARLKALFESGPVRLSTRNLRIPNTPESKIARYLDLLDARHSLFRVAQTPEEKLRRDKAIAAFCIDSNNFPESFFQNRKERDKLLGLGNFPMSIHRRDQLKKTILIDQQKRLKQWVKHLNDPASGFPIWFRYYVFSSIVKLQEFDTKSKTFPRRSASNTANFPELNPQVLNDIYQFITDPDFPKIKDAERMQKYFQLGNRERFGEIPPADSSFVRLLNFWTNDFEVDFLDSMLSRTQGQWTTFEQDTYPSIIVKSLSGHNTGWCTANYGQAYEQTQAGKIYIYFTPNDEGDYVVPRALVRMSNDSVREVRGRLPDQEVEPEFVETVDELLAMLPGGNRYFRCVSDMKELTKIIDRNDRNDTLTREELIFIYQIEKSIIGFGTAIDPRVHVLLDKRNAAEDLATIFNCDPAEIAFNPEDLSDTTRVCAFSINRKVTLAESEYPNVIAVVGSVNFERLNVTLPNLTFVSGNARMIESHENLTIVRGRLEFSNVHGDLPNLTLVGSSAILSSAKGSLPKLEQVGKDVFASYSKLSLPSLRSVGGDFWLNGARFDWLADELIVGGEIHGAIPPTKSSFEFGQR